MLRINETPFKSSIPKVSFDQITPINDCSVTKIDDLVFDTNQNDELRVLRLVSHEMNQYDMETKTECHQNIMIKDGKQFLVSVACDACNMDPIYGLRFKCVECFPDFDLCEECYRTELHEHKMRCLLPASAVKADRRGSGITIL